MHDSAVVQTTISCNDSLMASIPYMQQGTELNVDMAAAGTRSHRRAKTHTVLEKPFFGVLYLMMHTTHTLYQHTTSHANTCLVLIKVGYSMRRQCRLEKGCDTVAVYWQQKSFLNSCLCFWLISGQNSSSVLERGMWGAFMRETWLLYHHNRVPDGKTDRKQLTVWEMTESKGEKAKVSIR